MVLEAGRALGDFSSSDWLHEIDVPTSVVVTMRDQVVPLRRQARLFEWIPGAEAFRVDAGHDAVVAKPRRVRAAARAGRSSRPSPARADGPVASPAMCIAVVAPAS